MTEKNPARNFILLALLAALCVGSVELIACKFAAPEIYEEIVTPVRNLYHGARTRVKGFSENYARWLTARGAERDELIEIRRLRAETRRGQLIEQKRLTREREILKQERERVEALSGAAQLAGMPSILRDLTPADPAVTELYIGDDGREYLTGGDHLITYYNQKDEIWVDQPYGRDKIGGYGCGPTALAMAVSSLKDYNINPAEMAAWAASEGYSAPGSGSWLSIIQGAAIHYGLKCESLADLDADELYARLASGDCIISLMGPGHFTARGHFILLHGATLSGEILIADPNSRENTLALRSPDLIISELSASRNDGAPIWSLSPLPED